MIQINISNNIPESSIVLLATAESDFGNFGLSGEEINYIKTQLVAKSTNIALNKNGRWLFVQPVDPANDPDREKEKMRRNAAKLHRNITQQKIRSAAIADTVGNAPLACAFAEGLVLSNYQFLKYIGKKEEKQYSLAELTIVGAPVDQTGIDRLNFVLTGVYRTRDLVNEPANVLTPMRLAEEIKIMGQEAGFDVQVFDKAAIEEMKMGGILAVNKGSTEAPTFSILEWKPASAKNKRPIILAGKGITYDTGGHSLKTGSYMNDMKCDMAGAATVAATIYAIARSQLPVHVVGLVPSTDNRLSADAYSPGDIITMYNGATVEVLNTDAEGRIILADALAYAKKYDPELVVDIATLTGAAHRAIGDQGLAVMGNAPRETMERLKSCGESVHERMVEFPLWEEYFECLQSDIADLKNVGGEYAGMITAGKFLEFFTAYPYIHLDIAGPAFANKTNSYLGKGGTGFGVRLLFEFLKSY
ncbi:MAG: leucyl aminopeptidase [Bacteroidales bacterium]|jgi:leucyl aminopeptidase|nr:leucyl aminopeptidase [Bacteroidales bacterium]